MRVPAGRPFGRGHGPRRAVPVAYRWVVAFGDDAHLLNLIVDIHRADPEFGYRLITDELHRQGVVVSENRVQGLCQSQGT